MKKNDIYPAILLLFITFLLYGRVLNLWFTYDDPQILKQAVKFSPLQHPLFENGYKRKPWTDKVGKTP